MVQSEPKLEANYPDFLMPVHRTDAAVFITYWKNMDSREASNALRPSYIEISPINSKIAIRTRCFLSIESVLRMLSRHGERS